MPNKITVPIEHTIYETLKSAILQNKLATGTQLIEATICKKFEASRTPVRNALKKLSEDNLVDIIANKGAFVIQPSSEDIIKAYELREEFEIISLKLCINKIDEEDIKELNSIIKEEYDAINNGDIDSYLSLNKKFHVSISKKTGNKFLVEFTENIIDRLNIYLQIYDTILNVNLNDVSHINDHEVIVDLLSKKDLIQLELVARNHIISSLKDLELDKIEYTSLDDLF